MTTVVKRTRHGGTRLHRGTYGPSKPANVDFGTYHHSTPEESREIRLCAEEAFSKILRSLYRSGARLRVLDAGCGLGFLTYVAANCFPKARITGVDVFKHRSMSGFSIDKAANNMRSLGIEARTSFLKHDLTKPMDWDEQYDLVVSNLVFHNIGAKRLKAYETVSDVLKPGGFFVLGDLFPHERTDMDYLRQRATLIDELDQNAFGPWVYKIKVFRKPEVKLRKDSRGGAKIKKGGSPRGE
jgi:SAM-dependent methyltransferase